MCLSSRVRSKHVSTFIRSLVMGAVSKSAFFVTALMASLIAVSDHQVQADTIGASVPWTTYEAEDSNTNGYVSAPNRLPGNAAGEASGRRYVSLVATNEYAEVTAAKPFNSVVVRLCVPSTTVSNTLSLYINGTHKADINVTAKYSWQSGDGNRPGGSNYQFYDEARVLLGTTYAQGATVRLQKDSTDTCSFYHIDLIELEQVAPALAMPANYLSIASYGATGNDTTDDANAVVNCISAAKAQGKGVWIPAGKFYVGARISISNVTIKGAGMWHSRLFFSDVEDAVGFKLTGSNCKLYDFALDGNGTHRDNGGNAFSGYAGTGSIFQNLWIEHVRCGFWLMCNTADGDQVTDGAVIDGCRIRNTWADGVNLNEGTRNSTVRQCHARNTGDDSFAIWPSNYVANTAGTGNVIQNCSAENPWYAHCFAIYGGGNTIKDCTGKDTITQGGLTVNSDFQIFGFTAPTTITRVRLIRCGGTYYNPAQELGAVWIMARDYAINDVTLSDLQIDDATYSGILIQGPLNVNNLKVINTSINTAGAYSTVGTGNKYGVFIKGDAKGSTSLTNVAVTNTPLGYMLNSSGGSFSATSLGLYADTFEDGNYYADPVWTMAGGAWSVVADDNKVLKQSSVIGEAVATTGNSAWVNYSVQAKVKVHDNIGQYSSSGIIGRYKDSNNYYLLRLNKTSNQVQLYRKVSGIFSMIDSAALAISLDTPYRLKLVMSGSAISGYVDGLQYVNVSDASVPSGKVGARIYSQTATIDDVFVSNN